MSNAYGSTIHNGASAMMMAAAARTMSKSNTATPILMGGLVWEIASMDDNGIEDRATHRRREQVMALMLNSKTPTDSELEVGLPPAFYPPSKIRTQKGAGQTNRNGSAKSSSTALTVPRYTPALMFWNVLWGLPINRGFALQTREAEPFAEENYRLSTRTGVNGFSLTAVDTLRTRSSSAGVSSGGSAAKKVVAKAARLRPQLLRPPTTPLNPFATQHLIATKRQVVALNVQGLHYFESNTVLSSLAEALIAADSPEIDESVTSYFTGYGYKEGCSMCLALAIGTGPAGGDALYSERVRRAALDAALHRALVPRLEQVQENQNSFAGVVPPTIGDGPTDPFMPAGFKFVPSALSEGLTILFSRLARPVWNKPLHHVYYTSIIQYSVNREDVNFAWTE